MTLCYVAFPGGPPWFCVKAKRTARARKGPTDQQSRPTMGDALRDHSRQVARDGGRPRAAASGRLSHRARGGYGRIADVFHCGHRPCGWAQWPHGAAGHRARHRFGDHGNAIYRPLEPAGAAARLLQPERLFQTLPGIGCAHPRRAPHRYAGSARARRPQWQPGRRARTRASARRRHPAALTERLGRQRIRHSSRRRPRRLPCCWTSTASTGKKQRQAACA